MEVIKRGKTPDGVDIQIEDWNGRFDIGAYPIAKNAKKPWIDSGERFRLTLSGFNEDEVGAVFDKLVSGEITLVDLRRYLTYQYFEMLIADTKTDEERRELFQNAKKYVSGYVYGQYENISTKEQDEIIRQVCEIINIFYDTGY